jgi:hypothetical protein
MNSKIEYNNDNTNMSVDENEKIQQEQKKCNERKRIRELLMILQNNSDYMKDENIKELISWTIKLNKRYRTKKTRVLSNTGFGLKRTLKPITCLFMNIDEGEMKSSSEINKYICTYIKDNNLQSAEDGKKIFFKIDSILASVLQAKEGAWITFRDLQSYLKNTYYKKGELVEKIDKYADDDSKCISCPSVQSTIDDSIENLSLKE